MATLPTTTSAGVPGTVDHFEKYKIKYLVKFVVEKTMKDISRQEHVPFESSTPMPKRPNVRETQVIYLQEIFNHYNIFLLGASKESST